MTDLPTNFRPKVPVAGCIKIGGIVPGSGQDGKMPKPDKLDHFRYCAAQPDRTGYYPDHPDFAKENAQKLRSIPIELPSDNIGLLLEQSRVVQGRSCCLCRSVGGGKAQRRKGMEPTGYFEDITGCGDECPYSKPGGVGVLKCKVATIFRLIIPGHTPLGSLWQFRSHGWNTGQEIKGSLEALKRITNGYLANLPLRLVMKEQRRDIIVNGKRMPTSFWSVAVEFDPSRVEKSLDGIGESRGYNDMLALVDALDRARFLRERIGNLNAGLEASIKAQGQTIGYEEPNEAAAIAAEFAPDAQEPLGAATDFHEWTKEDRESAMSILDDICNSLLDWGVPDETIGQEIDKIKNKVGDPEISLESFENRATAFLERYRSKLKK